MTTSPNFDKTTSGAVSESAKSLVSHAEKLPSEEPASSPAYVFLMPVKFKWIFSWLINKQYGKSIATHNQPIRHREKDGQDGESPTIAAKSTSEGKPLGQSLMVFNDP